MADGGTYLSCASGIEIITGENVMKIKGLVFVTCLAAGALIASPVSGEPEKKSASASKAKRMSPHATQAKPSYHYQQNRQNVTSRTGSTRYYGGTRYSGTRSYVGSQYSGTR